MKTPWRADARYPAVEAQIIAQYIAAFTAPDGSSIGTHALHLISNDNAFMSADGYAGFGMRCLLARFEPTPEPTTGAYALVRTRAMTLLALLTRHGDGACAVSVNDAGETGAQFRAVASAVATAAEGGDPPSVTIMLTHSNDTYNVTGMLVANVSVAVNNTPFAATDALAVVAYVLDDAHTAANEAWVAAGSPPIPAEDALIAMWAATDIPLLLPPTPIAIANGVVTLPPIMLIMPSVVIVHIASRAASVPAQPSGVVAYLKPVALSLLNSSRTRELLLRWECANASRVVLDYEVALAPSANGPFSPAPRAAGYTDFACMRILPVPIPSSGSTVVYAQVTAIDYWGSRSAPSTAVRLDLSSS